MANKKLFTSESVTEGHPDKLCDQISDSILDAILEKDPQAHVACETIATTGMVAMESVQNQYLGGDTSLSCSAETAALIDKRVSELIRR